MVYTILIAVYSIIYIRLTIKTMKRSTNFGMTIGLLFLYSVFTMIGYTKYPEKLSIVSEGQYYGESIFIYFYLYLLGFVLFIYIFSYFLNGVKIGHALSVRNVRLKERNVLFYIIISSILVFLVYHCVTNISSSSYKNQYLLKENKLWFFLYEFAGVIILLLFNVIIRFKKVEDKIKFIPLLYLTGYLSVFMLTSLMFGQRVEIFMTIVGIITMLIEEMRDGNANYRLPNIAKVLKKILPIMFIGVFTFQLIRGVRGKGIDTYSINLSDQLDRTLSVFFDIQSLTFQDWLNPSLSLITAMQYNFVKPSIIIQANLFNLFSFISHYSVSPTTPLRDLFAPGSTAGLGYYFATEGYMLAGPLGFIVSAFLITFYYKVYDTWFEISEDKELRSYLKGIIGFYTIALVRGYSLFFIKGIIYYIIPGLLLYGFITGVTITRKEMRE